MSFHNLHRIHRITHFLYETKDVKYEDDDEEEKTSFCYEILMCTKKAGNNYKVFVQIVYYIHNRTMIYFLFIFFPKRSNGADSTGVQKCLRNEGHRHERKSLSSGFKRNVD